MARRSRRDVPDPEDYLPEEDEFEEEEEERPRKKRRRSRDEDEDEPPRRKRRSRRDEDEDEDDDEDDEEDEEEERPRKRRRSRRDDDEDDEEEERPRRKRRASRDDDDDDEDEEDEDDRPRRGKGKKKAGKKKRGSNRNSGWGGYQDVKSRSSSYADKLVVGKLKGETLVKFLDDAPFDSYGLHWFDEMDGKKGWICLETVGEDKCPGCDAGDRASPNALFNVLVFDDDGDPRIKVLVAGTRLSGQLESLAEGKGGLTGDYWSVVAGPKGSGTGNFQKVKERDLEEDWEVEPLTDDELDDWEEDRHVLEDVEMVPDYKEFKKAVREIED